MVDNKVIRLEIQLIFLEYLKFYLFILKFFDHKQKCVCIYIYIKNMKLQEKDEKSFLNTKTWTKKWKRSVL